MTDPLPKTDRSIWYHDVPAYMTEVYDWAYVNPRNAAWLDHNLVVRVLLFGNDQRLMRAYLQRIQPGMRVWQVAHVYGDLVGKAASRVGSSGRFELTDVTPVQVSHARRKLAGMPAARVHQADAGNFHGEEPYDLIVSFFLLHEVPDQKKCEIVDNMPGQVARGGRVLFVDYHRPAPWQPAGWLLRGVNRWLEPFAMRLWQQDIESFASSPAHFTWHKETVFGGVYQIVEVRRREDG